jgi:hypothetical protein
LIPQPSLLSTLLLVLLLLQARVLLKLNRPVDVAERGLVFVQNFLTLLAAKEAAGQVKPWFKEVCRGCGRAVGAHKQPVGVTRKSRGCRAQLKIPAVFALCV